ncbi:hypothetical protein [Bradyrhizobium symbiodeficiens]|uniref:hypothetical protein n=1 Tax=Bradyrhizobium symbiodeficiens TaxID=1404367 RepID=UPI000BA1B0A1|nr:hypothetical protein [Bradyrhizobium symbiodeficiens]QIP00565.1 hypothetical protein HAU86_12440 [Bradyrhizobium symbiodeficiens]
MIKQEYDSTNRIGSTREHLFWAREFIQLAKTQARNKGVSDQILAQAMLVHAWMLFTGQNEEASRRSVSTLFASSMAKSLAADSLAQSNSKPMDS